MWCISTDIHPGKNTHRCKRKTNKIEKSEVSEGTNKKQTIVTLRFYTNRVLKTHVCIFKFTEVKFIQQIGKHL